MCESLLLVYNVSCAERRGKLITFAVRLRAAKTSLLRRSTITLRRGATHHSFATGSSLATIRFTRGSSRICAHLSERRNRRSKQLSFSV